MPRFAASDGRMLAFDDTGGAGPPVLCLAGLTRNMRDFEALAAALAPDHRVIRLDTRGRGASDRAEDPAEEYTVQIETRDALELVAYLGLTRLAAIGTSRGGILGMAMAAAVPGLLSALVLNDVGGAVEVAGLRRIMAGLALPVPRSYGAAAARFALGNAPGFPDVPLSRWEELARATYDGEDGALTPAHDPAIGEVSAAGLGGADAQIELWPLFDATAALPVLVLRGANSDILSRATLAEMVRRHPDLKAIEIPKRGHVPFLDEPEAVSAIRAFLATVGG